MYDPTRRVAPSIRRAIIKCRRALRTVFGASERENTRENTQKNPCFRACRSDIGALTKPLLCQLSYGGTQVKSSKRNNLRNLHSAKRIFPNYMVLRASLRGWISWPILAMHAPSDRVAYYQRRNQLAREIHRNNTLATPVAKGIKIE